MKFTKISEKTMSIETEVGEKKYDPIFEHSGVWYFWDESQSNYYGPWLAEETARYCHAAYLKGLDGYGLINPTPLFENIPETSSTEGLADLSTSSTEASKGLSREAISQSDELHVQNDYLLKIDLKSLKRENYLLQVENKELKREAKTYRFERFILFCCILLLIATLTLRLMGYKV